jgi:hypothetical protein
MIILFFKKDIDWLSIINLMLKSILIVNNNVNNEKILLNEDQSSII